VCTLAEEADCWVEYLVHEFSLLARFGRVPDDRHRRSSVFPSFSSVTIGLLAANPSDMSIKEYPFAETIVCNDSSRPKGHYPQRE